MLFPCLHRGCANSTSALWVNQDEIVFIIHSFKCEMLQVVPTSVFLFHCGHPCPTHVISEHRGEILTSTPSYSCSSARQYCGSPSWLNHLEIDWCFMVTRTDWAHIIRDQGCKMTRAGKNHMKCGTKPLKLRQEV